MAWVRIHDGALTHPKIGGLSNKSFRLWVWGLSYSQQHLTDGWLPDESLPVQWASSHTELITRGLWDVEDGGFRIHDYLDWNDSKDAIRAKRKGAAARKARWEATRSGTRSERDLPTTPTPHHTTPRREIRIIPVK